MGSQGRMSPDRRSGVVLFSAVVSGFRCGNMRVLTGMTLGWQSKVCAILKDTVSAEHAPASPSRAYRALYRAPQTDIVKISRGFVLLG
jgi:hypothetical protein